MARAVPNFESRTALTTDPLALSLQWVLGDLLRLRPFASLLLSTRLSQRYVRRGRPHSSRVVDLALADVSRWSGDEGLVVGGQETEVTFLMDTQYKPRTNP